MTKRKQHPVMKVVAFAGATLLAVLGVVGQFIVESDSTLLSDHRVHLTCIVAAAVLYLLGFFFDFRQIQDAKRRIREAPDDAADQEESQHEHATYPSPAAFQATGNGRLMHTLGQEIGE